MHPTAICFKILLVFFLFAFLNFSNIHAQRVDFEELKKDIVKAQSNREKANAMMSLGAAFGRRQSNLTLQYADSILAFTNKEDSVYFQKAANYLKAVSLYRQGKLAEAIPFFEESETFFLKNYLAGAAKCKNFIGIIYRRLKQPEKAIYKFESIFEILEEENVQGRLSAHGNLGIAYRDVRNYSKSIENFEEAIALDSSNLFSVTNSYLQIASIYADMEMYEKSIQVLRRVKQHKLEKSPIKVAYFNNLGELFFNYNQTDSAKHYIKLGIALAENIKAYPQSIQNRLMLAEIYLQNGDNEEALSEIKHAGINTEKYNNPEAKIGYYDALANYYLHEKNADSAIFYSNEILKSTKNPNLTFKKKNAYLQLAKAYELKGSKAESNTYYSKHNDFQDSLSKRNSKRFLAEAKAKYLSDQKDEALSEQSKESGFLKKWQIILLITIIGLILIAILIFIRLKKSNTQLIAQEEENTRIVHEVNKHKKEILELKSKAILTLDEIVSIESDGHYLEFYLSTKDKPEIDRNRLREIKASLPARFVQIHRSFIVNIDFIKIKYADKIQLIDGRELPVSRTYKAELNNIMKNRK